MNVTYGYLVYTCYLGAATDLLDWKSVFAGNWNKNTGDCAVLSPWAPVSLATINVLSEIEDLLLGGDSTNLPGCIIFANMD